jgi:putative transcriptional regulator
MLYFACEFRGQKGSRRSPDHSHVEDLETLNRRSENIPALIKDVRRQLGLSQEELAHALGVSFATVNRWENGRAIPSRLARRQIEQLCREKNISSSPGL